MLRCGSTGRVGVPRPARPGGSVERGWASRWSNSGRVQAAAALPTAALWPVSWLSWLRQGTVCKTRVSASLSPLRRDALDACPALGCAPADFTQTGRFRAEPIEELVALTRVDLARSERRCTPDILRVFKGVIGGNGIPPLQEQTFDATPFALSRCPDGVKAGGQAAKAALRREGQRPQQAHAVPSGAAACDRLHRSHRGQQRGRTVAVHQGRVRRRPRVRQPGPRLPAAVLR